MRNKIIAVNTLIVLLVGMLAFFIVRTQLSAATTRTEPLKLSAQRDAVGVATKVELDALLAERWLLAKAADPSTRALLTKATAEARLDAARQVADQIAAAAPGAIGAKPTLVAIVDSTGRILGRNGSDLSRGDDLSAAYSGFKDALAKSSSGSELWLDPKRADKFVASYVPVRDEDGRAMMIVLGVALNDALGRAAAAFSGRGVALINEKGELLASTQATDLDEVMKVVKDPASIVKGASATGTVIAGANDDVCFAAALLDGLGGKKNTIVAIADRSLLPESSSIPLSILGVMALGLVLVVVGGFYLGNYISAPIGRLEEGLLAILNGQTDKRFELDHSELGGLAFRIDQLLNQLMGVEEDNTDEEGRVSRAASVANFSAAYSVERTDAAASLADEPADAYYTRLYDEYIAAKRSLGEQVDHITDAIFRTRIQSMEQEASEKHGRPVRYQVQVNDQEVVLLAVPL